MPDSKAKLKEGIVTKAVLKATQALVPSTSDGGNKGKNAKNDVSSGKGQKRKVGKTKARRSKKGKDNGYQGNDNHLVGNAD